MKPTTFLATLALLMSTAATLAQNGQAMPAPDRHQHPGQDGTIVTVQGEGEVRLQPDRAAITIGVSAQAETAEEVQKQVSAAMDRVLREVKGLDLPGALLTTSGISLNPVFDNSPRRTGNQFEEPRIVGYRASNTVNVRMDDVARVGEVIDSAAGAGSNTIHGIQFMLQDENSAQRDALRDAVAKARAKADTIADAIGRPINAILEISEGGAVRPIFPGRGGAEMFSVRAAADVSTPVEAGEIVVRASVTMTVRLAN